MQKQIRQGDILFIKVEEAPEDAKPIKRVEGRLIVAEGEATGHHHAIATPDVEMLERDNIRWLVSPEEFVLEHDEHDKVRFDPGVWQVVYQREYDPRQNRRVLD